MESLGDCRNSYYSWNILFTEVFFLTYYQISSFIGMLYIKTYFVYSKYCKSQSISAQSSLNRTLTDQPVDWIEH